MSSQMLAREDVLMANLRLAELELGVFSPRKQFSPAYINELAESIQREGQLKPIIVRLHPAEPNRYQVIDGEHRVRALKKLGRSLVRAEVRKLGDLEADVLAMAVNERHGKRLNPFEEGLHLQKLMQKYGWSQEEVGRTYHRSQQWVSDRLKIVADASEALIQSFTTRVVNVAKAREITKLPKNDQPKIIKKVVDRHLSVKCTKALVHALKAAGTPEKKRRILDKPVEVYAQLFRKPKALERALTTAPEEPVGESVACPGCGRKIWIDYVERTYTWEGLQ